MAIFGFKKRKDEKLEQEAKVTKSASEKGSYKEQKVQKLVSSKSTKAVATKSITAPILSSGSASNTASVIISPCITEKSGILSQSGVYTFKVTKDANKMMVSKAIIALYKVNPVKIAMINTPERKVFVKGRKGTVSGIRKAIVTVKKGEKIDFV
ncbi:MAG: 50S ribosomal protein L23 [Candidatus Paceibacterota bacterium]|jgi:large subunit ribosomal protein L23